MMVELMINRKSWEEFRNSGLLWWINKTLHMFGWAIVVNIENEKSVTLLELNLEDLTKKVILKAIKKFLNI